MPIDIDKLLAVKTIAAHTYPDRPCPDGVASALILRDALPEAEVVFVTHGAELDKLSERPNVLYCDIAPARECAGAIVLDHHVTSRHLVERYEANGVYSDRPGVSGAMLAYREVWLPVAYRGPNRPANHVYEGRGDVGALQLARLAGVRDTWQRDSPDWEEACAQAEALAFWPWKKWSEFAFDGNGFTRELEAMLAIGPVLYEKKMASARKLALEAHRATTEKGTRLAIVPTRETSDVAEFIGDEADVVIGFSYARPSSAGPVLALSLRSHGGYHVGALCKKLLGGGGHQAAAGAEVQMMWDSWCPGPYERILHVFKTWEQDAQMGSAL